MKIFKRHWLKILLMQMAGSTIKYFYTGVDVFRDTFCCWNIKARFLMSGSGSTHWCIIITNLESFQEVLAKHSSQSSGKWCLRRDKYLTTKNHFTRDTSLISVHEVEQVAILNIMEALICKRTFPYWVFKACNRFNEVLEFSNSRLKNDTHNVCNTTTV